MKLNCVNDVLSWFDDACKNSSYGLVVADDGTFRTCAYFVNIQFIRSVSKVSLGAGDGIPRGLRFGAVRHHHSTFVPRLVATGCGVLSKLRFERRSPVQFPPSSKTSSFMLFLFQNKIEVGMDVDGNVLLCYRLFC